MKDTTPMTQNDSSRLPALVIATLGAFLTPFMVSGLTIALPVIGQEFKADAVSLSWVATAYLLATTVFLVPFGRLADIYGRKRILTYGMVIYTLSVVLAAMSLTMGFLIAARVLEGVGTAMIFGTSLAILTDVFPLQERGKVLGINVAAVYLGLSLGPFIGGSLTQYLGWRSIFLLNVPLGLVILALLIFKLPGEWREAEGERFDSAGSTVFGLSLMALIYGLSQLPNTLGAGLVAAGIVGIAAFAGWELRSASPVLNLSLFKNNKPYVLSNTAALINYSATAAIAFLLSLYLQYIKGLTPQQAGLVLIAQPAVMVMFSPMAGRLSDKIEPRVVASTGMAITTTGLILFAFLNTTTSIAWIIVGLMLVGFGFALFSSPNMNAIMSSVDRRFYGVASGMVGTMRLLGQMFSMAIAMTIFAVVIGRVQIAPEQYGAFMTSVRLGFAVFAALCFLGIGASLTRGRVRG